MPWKRLLLVLLIAYGAYHHFQTRPIALAQTGRLADAAPVQHMLAAAAPHRLDAYTVTPLAEFSLEAVVLGVERYRLDREADLAPVDLALGWGPMSDPRVIHQVRISQGNRFYFWRVDRFPIPREAIETHSANMHIIPAHASVSRQLARVRPGYVVRLRGHLVSVSADDGWQWRSSLSRQDTGYGACELVWVEALELR